jgi:hypothetical protein
MIDLTNDFTSSPNECPKANYIHSSASIHTNTHTETGREGLKYLD